ncbi:hypothetical protein ZEAMMB73_Zm00001d040325 [Zea mays]|uniref:Uncharacterized protein n=1 Tax=Zea mays TaxID=4577 RepID=A0A1D6MQ81_MAIZE|nr:hypothetical protein ZEAMMB73_Zm00001d040325 [Zea mays]
MVAENLAPGYGLEQRLPNGSSKKGTPRSASQRWMPDKPRTPSSRRTYSIGEPGKLTTGFSRSARMGNLNPRDRAFASLSNIADLKSAADAATEDLDNEFDHIDESHYVARRAYHSPLCSSQAVSLEVAATATGTGAKPSRVSVRAPAAGAQQIAGLQILPRIKCRKIIFKDAEWSANWPIWKGILQQDMNHLYVVIQTTLFVVQNNLCTPKNGEILVASTQDFLTSSFLYMFSN